ncbi:MAG: response regulator [Chitinophagaceae bacterium]|nr:response regulator [Chitinophagaceae bacterium]
MNQKHIVLAEDDSDDCELLIDTLNKRTDVSRVTTVQNGVDLLALLEYTAELSDLPDLIILDHNMPRMNGQETLQLLKASPRYSKIPVAIFSTQTSKLFTAECLALGAVKVYSKPTEFAKYQETIFKIIETI